MEQPTTGRINQISATEDHAEISIYKPVTRSHSARFEAVNVTKSTSTTLMSRSKSYRYPTHQDNQIIINSSSKPLNKSQVWDCGSSLYDSFELNSLNLQLDMAIKGSSIRTLSMPHLPEPHAPSPSSAINKHQLVPKNHSRFSKSLDKILRSVFGSSKGKVNKIDTTTPSSFTKVKACSERRKSSLYMSMMDPSPCVCSILSQRSKRWKMHTPSSHQRFEEQCPKGSLHLPVPSQFRYLHGQLIL